MKDIVIIANYIHFKNEAGNSRFLYIADKLESKCNVEIITSTFYHREKKQRQFNEKDIKDYNVKLLYEPGYKKNISLKRIYSNYILAKNILKYLKNRKKPDLIYCSVPPTIISQKVAKYAKKNNIRFIIDIQDLWPEAYEMVFKIPVMKDILFFPIRRQANYTYKNANDIVAVSDTYLKRASEVNKIAKNKISIFLGTDLKYFDECRDKEKKIYRDNKIRIAYIGTLGHSYDIKLIIDAINVLKNRNITNIKFVVMGDGPLKEEFEKYSKEKKVDCEFTGRLNYDKMVGILCSCDIAVNPIKAGSAGSIINKVGDYAAASLPVINTQECEEYRKLVNEYNIGYNCKNGNFEDVANKIECLYKNKKLREEFGNNNRFFAKEKFDRCITYEKITNLILK